MFTKNWTDDQGNHQGGVSYGEGFTISWQRGPLQESGGQNGAFLIEVLEACESQLAYYQDSKFGCQENLDALNLLRASIQRLKDRRDRRQNDGTLGTHLAENTALPEDYKRKIEKLNAKAPGVSIDQMYLDEKQVWG
jgi:hypothetical protein